MQTERFHEDRLKPSRLAAVEPSGYRNRPGRGLCGGTAVWR